MTGHLSLDFLVCQDVAKDAEKRVGVSNAEVRELMNKIYPIECNPRVHTAAVLLADVSEDLAEAYLSILPDHEPKGISNGHRAEALVVPKPGVPGYYWIGHDLVTRVLIPLLGFLRFEVGLREMMEFWLEFAEHVLYWRDGTWEVWDPWPAWWLYVGYWPAMFFVRLLERRWWSRWFVFLRAVFFILTHPRNAIFQLQMDSSPYLLIFERAWLTCWIVMFVQRRCSTVDRGEQCHCMRYSLELVVSSSRYSVCQAQYQNRATKDNAQRLIPISFQAQNWERLTYLRTLRDPIRIFSICSQGTARTWGFYGVQAKEHHCSA
jgi:hypothetical protein